MSAFPTETAVAVYHFNSSTNTYPASADITTSGCFLPLDRKDHALEGMGYSDPHELFLDQSVAIRVSDKVVIASSTYFVKQIFTADFGGLQHKRVSLSAEV